MFRQEKRNEKRDLQEINNSGTCKLYGVQADVSSFFSGTIECRTDLQKTYRYKGYKCSLQEWNSCKNPVCSDVCSLIQKKY